MARKQNRSLVLTRKEGESIVIHNGDPRMPLGVIKIAEIGGEHGKRVKLVLHFPDHLRVLREELLHRIA